MEYSPVYAPTFTQPEEEIEQRYDDEYKSKYNITIGNFNANMGNKQEESKKSTEYGVGERNERGGMLLNYRIENNLIMMNPFFKKKQAENRYRKVPTEQLKMG